MSARPSFIAGAWVVVLLVIVAAAFAGSEIRRTIDPPTRPSTTTTTSVLPWCEGESLVVPGTGIVEFAPRCDQPPEHAQPGTGPTTGPNGEHQ